MSILEWWPSHSSSPPDPACAYLVTTSKKGQIPQTRYLKYSPTLKAVKAPPIDGPVYRGLGQLSFLETVVVFLYVQPYVTTV